MYCLGDGYEVAALCGRDGLFRQAHGRPRAGADLYEDDPAVPLSHQVDFAGRRAEVSGNYRVAQGLETGPGEGLAPTAQVLPGPAHLSSSIRRGWMKGEKVRRWIGQGPSTSMALRCSGVG